MDLLKLCEHASIFPVEPGKKYPAAFLGKTEALMHTRVSAAQINLWVKDGVRDWGMYCGPVSGNMEVLDFDEKWDPGLYDRWFAKLSDDTQRVVQQLPLHKTRNNGKHLIFRCEFPRRNHKVAFGMRWQKGGKPADKNEPEAKYIKTALIETRGGDTSYSGVGLILIPPTDGYEVLQGNIAENVPMITEDVRDELFEVAATFSEIDEDIEDNDAPQKTGDVAIGDKKPGDLFNEDPDVTFDSLLIPHGWQKVRQNQWVRPGKSAQDGISATTNYKGIPILHVFSSNAAPFEEEKNYTKFAVYTFLNFNKDFTAAAKAVSVKYGVATGIKVEMNFKKKEEAKPKEFETTWVSAPDLIRAFQEEYAKRKTEDFISFGYPEFDEQMSGIYKGDLIILGGKTGTGKTTFSSDMLYRAARAGRKCFIYGLEDTLMQYTEKMIYFEQCKILHERGTTGYTWNAFTRHERVGEEVFDETYKQAMERILEKMGATLFFYKLNEQLTIAELERSYRQAHAHGAELMLIDHLHQMNLTEDGISKESTIESHMVKIKALQKELYVPVVMIAHYKKLGNEKPDLESFKDANAISQNANYAILLDRMTSENKEGDTIVRFDIAKARNPNGTAEFYGFFARKTGEYRMLTKKESKSMLHKMQAIMNDKKFGETKHEREKMQQRFINHLADRRDVDKAFEIVSFEIENK